MGSFWGWLAGRSARVMLGVLGVLALGLQFGTPSVGAADPPTPARPPATAARPADVAPRAPAPGAGSSSGPAPVAPPASGAGSGLQPLPPTAVPARTAAEAPAPTRAAAEPPAPTRASADPTSGGIFFPPTRTPRPGEPSPAATSAVPAMLDPGRTAGGPAMLDPGLTAGGPAVFFPAPPPSPSVPNDTSPGRPDVVAGPGGGIVRRPPGAIGSYPAPSWTVSCDRALQYWEQIQPAAQAAQIDPQLLAGLLTVEGSGERAVSPAGALGLMQLLPDKFAPGDDPFRVETNLRRAAEHLATLNARFGSPERVAAAYFGAIDANGEVSGASDGYIDGYEYVRRFKASLACVRSGLGVPGETLAALVSPLGARLRPDQISFGFLDDYGSALASYVRGAHGVQQYGTLHLAWDLVVPGAPDNGRGSPVFAPLAGRIVRTSDPVGGPNGIWIESTTLNLRARLMHLDSLAPGIVDGAQVHAGQWVGALGGQGTEDFPHLHLSLELLSSGARLDPAQFYFRGEPRPLVATDLEQNGAGGRTVRLDGLESLDQPRADGNTVIWVAHPPTGAVLRGYDLGSGWGFQVSGVDAVQPSNPAVGADNVVWLDRRQVAASADPGDDSRADIFAYDLRRGQERRLSDYASHYVDLTVDGTLAAWIDRREPFGYVEVYDLASDTRRYVSGSFGQPRDLTLKGSLLAWIDGADVVTGPDASLLHVYDLANGRHQLLAARGPSEPALVGNAVFWLERSGERADQVVRGRDLQTGRDWTVTSTAARRWGLRASDGQLLWQELRGDGQVELRLAGLASDERRLLAERPFGSASAALGHGTVVWSDRTDSLLVAAFPSWDLPNGRFFVDLAGRRDAVAQRGFSLTNQSGIRLWDEYRRLGGEAALGRPVSARIRLADGWYYQATESAVLQWQPAFDRAHLVSPLELLQARGFEAALEERWRVPAPLADGPEPARLDLLTDEPIRQRFLARAEAPNRAWSLDEALAWYGPPRSAPADLGNSIVQRFGRVVLQRPKVARPGQASTDLVAPLPLGEAVRQLVFDAQYGGRDAPDE